MSKQLCIAVLSLWWLAGCVAHERNGDRAAALGDWKTALREYRAALSNEPESSKLRDKYQQARREAAATAFRRAQACAAVQDWNCALGEADGALQIDDGNTEIAIFRANAAASLARAHLQAARELADRGEFKRAFERLERATVVSKQPEILQEAGVTLKELSGRAESEAERLRLAKAYPRAVELLTTLVALDGSKRTALENVQREYEEYRTAEYERLAQEGDAALGSRDWSLARERYAAALEMKPGGRAEPLVRYTAGVVAGEDALARRDFAASARGYEVAVESGQDRDGYAARQWEAVVIRPYAVRVRSVFAKPVRPDGRPWVGPPSKFLTKAVSLTVGGVAAATFGPAAGKIGKDLAQAYMDVPPENRPTLRVQATLPDGSMLLTPHKNGLYVVYDSEFVIATNQFDDRRLSFHVVHEDSDSRDDVGVIDISLKDLVVNRDAALGNQSIAVLELSAEPAPGKVDGMFSEMRPPRDPENRASSVSIPSPSSSAYRLKAVRVGIRKGDYQNELLDGPPDPYVELEQRGQVIYRSPRVQDDFDAAWEPRLVDLHVEDGEQLTIRAYDADVSDDDFAFGFHVPARALEQGAFQAMTPRGSYIRLVVEPKPGPGLNVATAD